MSVWGDEPDWLNDDPDDSHGGGGGDDGEGGHDDPHNDEEGSAMDGLVGAQHCLILLDCQVKMFQTQVPGQVDGGGGDSSGGSHHSPTAIPTTPGEGGGAGTGGPPNHNNQKRNCTLYALQACRDMVRAKLRTTVTHKTGKRDSFGILLYNTRYRVSQVAPAMTNPRGGGQQQLPVPATKPVRGVDDMNDDDDDDDDDPIGTGQQASTVHEFLPLEPPSIATIRTIQAALDSMDDPESMIDLERDYCPTQADQDLPVYDNSLQVALFRALQMYQKAKSVRSKRTGRGNTDKDSQQQQQQQLDDIKQIWIMTNDDNPCHRRPAVVKVIQTTLDDLKDSCMEVAVWPLPKWDQSLFDYSFFYDPIQAQTPVRDYLEQSRSNSNNAVLHLSGLLSAMQNTWKKIRRNFTVPLLMPDWAQYPDRPGIALDFYRLVQPARLPSKYQIHQETGRLLSRVRQIVTVDGSSTVLAEYKHLASNSKVEANTPGVHRLRTFVLFGNNERISMSSNDKVALKRAANANPEYSSFILLGFKDRGSIPMIHTMEQAFLAYPNEEDTPGSGVALAQLHAAMLRKNVVAIGELLIRVTATSRLVAMWPWVPTDHDDHGSPSRCPSGMVVIALPFEDEVRAIEPDAAVEALQVEATDLASEQAVQAAIRLVQKQMLEQVEIGESFENAYLETFWDYVEHVALEEPLVEKREFDTELDEDEVLRAAGEEIQSFLASLPDDAKPVTAGRKRKVVTDDSEIDWMKIYMDGTFSELTNADLKAKLRSVGEKISGNKAELIERLRTYLEGEFAAKSVKQEN